MFVHSGASLHGREFSKRPTQIVTTPSNLRHSLTRPNLSPTGKRASTFPADPAILRDNGTWFDFKKSKTFSDPISKTLNGIVANPEEADIDLVASQSEVRSEDEDEDEASITTEINLSRKSLVARRKRRSIPPKSTTFVLAHPPPKPRTQRIIHMRPNLVLQIQQVTPGMRPKPTIDVYPSFAGARSLVAPLLKRIPRIGDAIRELGVQDIMLVRSEDYASQTSGSESDGDEESIGARELLAILSPSKSEDTTEILMAEGITWIASTRSTGNSYAYEFSAVDATGTAITARWVRKQVVSSSLPGTPISPSHSSANPQFSDIKFIFSIVDPSCRRHPVLATLTSASLSIPDTYASVSQSSKRYSSASQNLPSADPSFVGDQNQTKEPPRPLEEWKKSFISVSAVWVALRHGWAPDFRPDEFMPFYTSATFPTDGCGRSRSLSASADSSPSKRHSDVIGRRKNTIGLRQHVLRSANDVPRRATSTGAAFMEKRRAALKDDDSQSSDGEHSRIAKLNRRALSGDWNIGLLKSTRVNSLEESVKATPRNSPKNEPGEHQGPPLAPSPLPVEHHTMSVYSPLSLLSTLSPNPSNCAISAPNDAPIGIAQKMSGDEKTSETAPKRKHRKLKSVVKWFRKLSAR